MTETNTQPMPSEPLPAVSSPTDALAVAVTGSVRAPDAQQPTSSRWRRLVLGNPTDPRWVRPTLLALLLGTALLYIWDLGASGWANSFYSAAVQAGTQSWKAFFFGSSDAANFITVDKPPASLWVMGISARIFGVNSWSILVPQALEGVAAVGFLYLTVRRWFSPAAGLIAGAILALTPVAVLMFRFNNPDALLVLLLVLAAYATTRAIEKANPYWLLLAATFIGTGFLTKMLQAYLVVPAFALAYLVAAPTSVRKRLVHLVLAGVALVVSSGWWVAIVELIPAADRPYIGGSQNNSVLELIWGYNGLGRITGNETGSVGGAPNGAGSSMWGPTGWDRMFGSQMGGQISWLLPAALILLVAMLVYAGRAGRSDRLRTAMIIWGGWLLTTAVVFSFAQGIIHEYYTVALAPAIAAIVGIGVHFLWERRDSLNARITLAATLTVTSVWAFVLLSRSVDWYPPLRFLILLGGVVAAVVIVALPRLSVRGVAIAAVAAAIIGLAGPTAYALQTASTPHVGSLPTAGPATAGGFGPGRGGAGGPGGGFGPGGAGGQAGIQGGPGGLPGQGGTGQFGNGPQAGLGQGRGGATGQLPGGATGGQQGGARQG
ncbi:MAG: glycosyltransferase family 39 protein, partial [Candidatus Nanopelagicales bacterium]